MPRSASTADYFNHKSVDDHSSRGEPVLFTMSPLSSPQISTSAPQPARVYLKSRRIIQERLALSNSFHHNSRRTTQDNDRPYVRATVPMNESEQSHFSAQLPPFHHPLLSRPLASTRPDRSYSRPAKALVSLPIVPRVLSSSAAEPAVSREICVGHWSAGHHDRDLNSHNRTSSPASDAELRLSRQASW